MNIFRWVYPSWWKKMFFGFWHCFWRPGSKAVSSPMVQTNASETETVSVKPNNPMRQHYIDLCHNWRDQRQHRKNQVIESIRQLCDAVVDLIKKYVEMCHSSRQAELEISGLSEALARRQKHAAAEFDDLIRTPGVKKVEIAEKGLIKVFTELITIEHEGQKYLIGEFCIFIDGSPEIQVKNLANRGSNQDFDHPQIRKGKINMPAQIRLPMIRLVMGLEYQDVAQIIINMLGTYEPSASYIPLEKNWRGEKV